ncbi:unnamed protein product [Rhizophagus irregularis]|nr:unnamed protein product [Rhizophagus irregularis]
MNIFERKPPICRENPIGNTEESLKKSWVRAGNNEPTILMGADVTYPLPGECLSYAALCDGVSESQFMKVLEHELTAIKDACQNLEVNYKPTITFVVVQKIHHTRFFPIQGADRTGNCFPGTVVDMNITHPHQFDFYLLSHAGLHGTSRPTHYHVLYDQNGFDANKLQMLSYNLCHTSARCTRAVSLVPPVYYAHLAAARARLHSSECSKSGAITFGVVKQELQKVMYFI